MKLVMTLLARDEADVVDAQVAFHLSAGVDYVVATDNRSRDGTTEILESYSRAGQLHLIREDSESFQQSAWVTRMAQLAARRFDADWVINSDADEFWWPRGGDLKDVLSAIPATHGVLRAPIRHFFLLQGDNAFFAERMVVRPLLSAPVNEPENPLRPNTHVIHRAHPTAVVTAGNHALRGSRHALLAGWHPIEVLHFPLRSVVQARRKYENWARTLVGREYRDAFEAHERGELERFIETKVVDDEVLARGLAAGSLVRDTRLRDALRTLRETGDPLEFPRPSLADEATYAAEVAVLAEADVVRLQRRLDELELRLARVERQPWTGVPTLLRRVRTKSL
jgi:hypothetical protein